MLAGCDAELARQGEQSAGSSPPVAATARRLVEPMSWDQAFTRRWAPKLDRHTVLLVYELGQPESRVMRLDANGLRTWTLPGRCEIESVADALRDLLQKRRQRSIENAAELGRHLSQMLLGSALAELDDQRLVILTDGALDSLPFAALPDPRSAGAKKTTLLVERHEIVQLPVSTATAWLKTEPRRVLPKQQLAVIADPVFGYEDPRLSRSSWPLELGKRAPSDLPRSRTGIGTTRFDRLLHTGQEADGLLAKASSAGLGDEPPLAALGFDATRELVLSGALEPFFRIHIATHGQADPHRAEGAGLVLSLRDRNGTPIPGLLSARDVARLRLNADLVVLSGCQTALAYPFEDDLEPSLAEAFLRAGARRVIASLWDVSDRSTAELMDRFYDHLLLERLPPAAALRAAQLAMAHDPRWQHPAHWAGFVFLGDWRRDPG